MSVASVLIPIDSAADPASKRSRLRAALALGFVALSLWCASASLAVLMPAFFGPDESAHLGYVASVAGGRLPAIEDPFPAGRYDVLDRLIERHALAGGAPNGRDVVWVANHPPGFYVLAVPAAAAGERLFPNNGALLGVRLLATTLMALAAVATGALAARLVPRRPAVAVGAAALFALSLQTSYLGSLGYSDPLAVLWWTLGLVVVVEVLRRPPRRIDLGLVIVSAATAVVAAGSRASLLPIVALIVGAWLVAAVLAARRGASVDAALAGAGTSLFAAGVVAVPWLVRNVDRYGSLTGDAALFERFHRSPRKASLLDLALDGDQWGAVLFQIWAEVTDLLYVGSGWFIWVVAAIAVGAAAMGSWRWLRSGRPWSARALLAWAVMGVASLMLVWGVLRFVDSGGLLHPRYLVPVLPPLSVAVAAGLWQRGRQLGLASAVLAMAVLLGLALREWRRILAHSPFGIDVPLEAWAGDVARALLVVWAVSVVAVIALLLADRGDPRAQRSTPALAEPPPGPVTAHQV